MISAKLQTAIQVLQRGGIIAYPTEAVFGLGCDPMNEAAVMRLLALKQRSIEKGLILIAASVAHLQPYIKEVSADRWQQVLSTWPGPYTWIFPATEVVPYWVRGEHTGIAVRVTAHPVARALCDGFGGAIVSTSANQSNQLPARSVAEVQAQFADRLDCIVPGDVNTKAQPSEIRDVLTGAIIRPG